MDLVVAAGWDANLAAMGGLLALVEGGEVGRGEGGVPTAGTGPGH